MKTIAEWVAFRLGMKNNLYVHWKLNRRVFLRFGLSHFNSQTHSRNIEMDWRNDIFPLNGEKKPKARLSSIRFFPCRNYVDSIETSKRGWSNFVTWNKWSDYEMDQWQWPDRPNDHCCVQMICNNRNKNRPIKSEQATPLMEHGTHKRTTMDTIDLLKSESNILRTIFFPFWYLTYYKMVWPSNCVCVCVCNFFLSQLLCADQLIRSSILPLRPTITRTHTQALNLCYAASKPPLICGAFIRTHFRFRLECAF